MGIHDAERRKSLSVYTSDRCWFSSLGYTFYTKIYGKKKIYIIAHQMNHSATDH